MRDDGVVRYAVAERTERAHHAADAVSPRYGAEIIAAAQAKRNARTDDTAEADADRIRHDFQLVPVFVGIELIRHVGIFARQIADRARIHRVGHGRSRIIAREFEKRTYHAADVVSARGDIRLVVNARNRSAERIPDKSAHVRIAVHGTVEREIFYDGMIGISEKPDADERFISRRSACRLFIDAQRYGAVVAVESAFERSAFGNAVSARRRTVAAVYGMGNLIFLIEMIFHAVVRVCSARNGFDGNAADHARKRRSGVVERFVQQEIIPRIIFRGIIRRTAIRIGVVIPFQRGINTVRRIRTLFGAVYRRFQKIQIFHRLQHERALSGSHAFARKDGRPLRVKRDVVFRPDYADSAVLSHARGISRFARGDRRQVGRFSVIDGNSPSVRGGVPIHKFPADEGILVDVKRLIDIVVFDGLLFHRAAESLESACMRALYRVGIEGNVIGVGYPHGTHADFLFGIGISDVAVIVVTRIRSAHFPADKRIPLPRRIAGKRREREVGARLQFQHDEVAARMDTGELRRRNGRRVFGEKFFQIARESDGAALRGASLIPVGIGEIEHENDGFAYDERICHRGIRIGNDEHIVRVHIGDREHFSCIRRRGIVSIDGRARPCVDKRLRQVHDGRARSTNGGKSHADGKSRVAELLSEQNTVFRIDGVAAVRLFALFRTAEVYFPVQIDFAVFADRVNGVIFPFVIPALSREGRAVHVERGVVGNVDRAVCARRIRNDASDRSESIFAEIDGAGIARGIVVAKRGVFAERERTA